jgi:D-alanyl-D-alanine carboxypeptidase/D-alanyl-D-alanine-endopeptidase (penicillin-binding protein 4)
LWFAHAFKYALWIGGIDVTGDAVDVDDVSPAPSHETSTILYSHRSATLAEIAQPLLKDSINLYGEAMLRLNTPAGAYPTNDAALEGLRMRLGGWGIPADGWQIVDGSGLSRRNAVSADTLVAVLQRMHDPGASPWMTGFPVAGRDGTLTARMNGTSAEGTVRAKTGSMSNVRTLAGYVRTADDETLAFAIMANAFEGPPSAAHEAIDRIAVRLATFSRTAH